VAHFGSLWEGSCDVLVVVSIIVMVTALIGIVAAAKCGGDCRKCEVAFVHCQQYMVAKTPPERTSILQTVLQWVQPVLDALMAC